MSSSIVSAIVELPSLLAYKTTLKNNICNSANLYLNCDNTLFIFNKKNLYLNGKRNIFNICNQLNIATQSIKVTRMEIYLNDSSVNNLHNELKNIVKLIDHFIDEIGCIANSILDKKYLKSFNEDSNIIIEVIRNF